MLAIPFFVCVLLWVSVPEVLRSLFCSLGLLYNGSQMQISLHLRQPPSLKRRNDYQQCNLHSQTKRNQRELALLTRTRLFSVFPCHSGTMLLESFYLTTLASFDENTTLTSMSFDGNDATTATTEMQHSAVSFNVFLRRRLTSFCGVISRHLTTATWQCPVPPRKAQNGRISVPNDESLTLTDWQITEEDQSNI